MAEWLQVNTSTGEIYSKLRTPADASGLPTEAGGTWIQVDPAEYELAVSGERPTWNNAASSPDRVEENPWPRLRFTGGNVDSKGYEFVVEVGEATPPTVGMLAVDRDGVAITNINATRRIKVEVNGVQKWKTVQFVSGVLNTDFDIPVDGPYIIRIENQEVIWNMAANPAEVDGFWVENPLVIVVAEDVSTPSF